MPKATKDSVQIVMGEFFLQKFFGGNESTYVSFESIRNELQRLGYLEITKMEGLRKFYRRSLYWNDDKVRLDRDYGFEGLLGEVNFFRRRAHLSDLKESDLISMREKEK